MLVQKMKKNVLKLPSKNQDLENIKKIMLAMYIANIRLDLELIWTLM